MAEAGQGDDGASDRGSYLKAIEGPVDPGKFAKVFKAFIDAASPPESAPAKACRFMFWAATSDCAEADAAFGQGMAAAVVLMAARDFAENERIGVLNRLLSVGAVLNHPVLSGHIADGHAVSATLIKAMALTPCRLGPQSPGFEINELWRQVEALTNEQRKK